MKINKWIKYAFIINCGLVAFNFTNSMIDNIKEYKLTESIYEPKFNSRKDLLLNELKLADLNNDNIVLVFKDNDINSVKVITERELNTDNSILNKLNDNLEYIDDKDISVEYIIRTDHIDMVIDLIQGDCDNDYVNNEWNTIKQELKYNIASIEKVENP